MKKTADEYSEKVAQARFEAALKGALKTSKAAEGQGEDGSEDQAQKDKMRNTPDLNELMESEMWPVAILSTTQPSVSASI
jgi:hypothetical protein